MEVILPAHIAARFAGLYSMRKAGYVLRSARVLGAFGYSVEVVEPERGLSVRGTTDDKLFSGDVVRKLLVQMEQQVDLSQAVRPPPQERSVAVKVRERASRRAVKQAVDAAEAEARAHKVAEQLVGWYNQQVGVSMLQYVRLGRLGDLRMRLPKEAYAGINVSKIASQERPCANSWVTNCSSPCRTSRVIARHLWPKVGAPLANANLSVSTPEAGARWTNDCATQLKRKWRWTASSLRT